MNVSPATRPGWCMPRNSTVTWALGLRPGSESAWQGVALSRRVPMEVTANEYNAGYLVTKNVRMGHKIPAASTRRPSEREPDARIEQGERPIVTDDPPAKRAKPRK